MENIQLLRENKADIAFAMSDSALPAYRDSENLPEHKQLRALAGLYLNYVQIVTLNESGIHSIADLRGKRIGVGAPGSGVEANARMVLGTFGMSYQDIQAEYLSYTEAMQQLEDGRIDAAFFTSGIPNDSVVDLALNKAIRFIPITADEADALIRSYPFFQASFIPSGTYPNTAGAPTAAIQNILLVRADLPDDIAYRLTEALFEHLDSLKEAHDAAATIELQHAWQSSPVPLHPGAEKFYKENAKREKTEIDINPDN